MQVLKAGSEKYIKQNEKKKLVTGECSICKAILRLDEQDMYGSEPLLFPVRKADFQGFYYTSNIQYGRITETICPYCGNKTTIKIYSKKRYKIYDNRVLRWLSERSDSVIAISIVFLIMGLLVGFFVSLALSDVEMQEAVSSVQEERIDVDD